MTKMDSQKVQLCFDSNRKYIKLFFGLCIMYSLYVLPIVLAGRYKSDDLARSVTGLTGWTGDGRPLTQALVELLSCGESAIDLFPLPLFLSVILLAGIITIYIRRNLPSFKVNLAMVFAFSLVITNPFMLENLSYHFDVLSMVLAFCIALVPFILPGNIHYIVLALVTAGAVICELSLYQVVICASLSLLALDIFLKITSRVGWRRFISIFSGIVVGAVFYGKVIAPTCIKQGDWRYQASGLKNFFRAEDRAQILANYYGMKGLLKTYLLSVPAIVLVIAGAGIILGMISVITSIWKQSQFSSRARVFKTVYILMLPVILYICNFLPMAFLTSGATKSRALLSVCVFEIWIAVLLLYLFNNHALMYGVAVTFCLGFAYIYSYAYGTAVKSQGEYEKMVAYDLVYDIESINKNQNYTEITIVGDAPRSQQSARIIQRFPQFGELIQPCPENEWWTSGSMLYHYMQYDLGFATLDEADQEVMKGDCVIDNFLYSIYVHDQKIIVKYKS